MFTEWTLQRFLNVNTECTLQTILNVNTECTLQTILNVNTECTLQTILNVNTECTLGLSQKVLKNTKRIICFVNFWKVLPFHEYSAINGLDCFEC